MYASVIGVMLPGNDTSVRFGARVTFAVLTRGGVIFSLAAAAASCFVVALRGRYPARSAAATSTTSSSTTIIRRLCEPNILGNPIPSRPHLLFHRLPEQSARRGSPAASCGASYT